MYYYQLSTGLIIRAEVQYEPDLKGIVFIRDNKVAIRWPEQREYSYVKIMAFHKRHVVAMWEI